MIWVTVVVFIALLLALVLIHEWGHFIVAKRAGCTVEEFGFGFPPRLFSVMWHGTRYSFNLFPLGGFVKIEGEDMNDPNPGPNSFAAKSIPWRLAILTAGVVMNVVLAVVLLTAQGVIGVPTVVTPDNEAGLTNQLTYIVDVVPNSPAEAAGLKAYDRIVHIDGIAAPTTEEVMSAIAAKTGQSLDLEIDRQGVHQNLSVIPRQNPPAGEGAMGVSLIATGITKVLWWQAPVNGLVRTWDMLQAIVTQFAILGKRVVTQGAVGETLTGPVGIAIYANEATKLGPSYVLEFGALISLNLALINILPIPALDGGRVLFVLLEMIFRRRFPEKIEQFAHTFGFVALIALMLAITWRDIVRFF